LIHGDLKFGHVNVERVEGRVNEEFGQAGNEWLRVRGLRAAKEGSRGAASG